VVKRYAEGTTVSVQSSRGEITGILAKHGCNHFATGTTPEGDTIQFVLGGKQFRMFIAKPTATSMYDRDRSRYTYPGNVDWEGKAEQEWKRRWRAHVLLIKAKLEFIEGGDTTLEQEFLPYAVLKDGRTVGDLIVTGGLPLLESGK
jgi:hypothetical protein